MIEYLLKKKSIIDVLNYYNMSKITVLLLTHKVRIEQHSQVENMNVKIVVNKKGNGNNQQGFGRGQSQN
ncbi:hypothetical protein Ddye_004027 [Dipteronia dyeriana]|uniref:Uncharacterized protein n=1 Tax=Dipteronia dyeriana TaxID=168575 RepID=A0AAD9XUV0_9ROSI|nr:hypothetical protein Ddye_004027 [Dipteronia dyeriana]